MGTGRDVVVMGMVGDERVAPMNTSLAATSAVVPGAMTTPVGVSAPSRAKPVIRVRAIPAAGDIVMDVYARPGGADQALVYVQDSATAVDQYRLRTREEAVAFALHYARRRQVRAWLTDNWFDFKVIDEVSAVGTVPDR